MKRILSLLLALAMALSLSVALISCGEPDPDPVKTTVTAEEFEAAFDFGTTFTLIFKGVSQEDGTMQATYKRNGAKIESGTKMTDTDGVEEGMTSYLEVVDDVAYMYMPDTDENDNVTGYIKMPYPQTMEQLMQSMIDSVLPGDLTDFTKYTYDETSKTYKAASITVELYGDETEFTDIEMTFEDGKLVSVTYKADEGEEVVPYTLTFDYAAPTITIPTENVTDMTEAAG